MTNRLITTADKVTLTEGDHAFNYYDMLPGTIGRIDDHAQPDTMTDEPNRPPAEWTNHWFRFLHDDGSTALLDGSRICSDAHAARKGWT